MTSLLLISDNSENLNVAWRHFCYKEYSAGATISIDSAMERLRSENPPQIAVYYRAAKGKGFFDFYSRLREDPATQNIPLLVLTDLEFQKVLSEYIKLKNAMVLGISVDDRRLMDIMRSAARNGFEKIQNRVSIFDRAAEKRKRL